MAEFPDLSPYCYQDRYNRPGTLNIGWLDLSKPYRTAVPTPEFIDALHRFATVSVALMRGAHFCHSCGPEMQKAGIGPGDHKIYLGWAELRVFATDGTIYAAPNLIYHYVKDHAYAPPDPFIEAVLTSPAPPDADYFHEMERHQLDWWDTFVAGNMFLARKGVRYRFVPGVGDVPEV